MPCTHADTQCVCNIINQQVSNFLGNTRRFHLASKSHEVKKEILQILIFIYFIFFPYRYILGFRYKYSI